MGLLTRWCHSKHQLDLNLGLNFNAAWGDQRWYRIACCAYPSLVAEGHLAQ